MRELKVVGLDVDGKRIILEGDNPGEMFTLRADDRLRAAVRGDSARIHQTQIDYEVRNVLSPREIQSRIRAGASVEQLAAAAGVDVSRIERFAHPVLLERARAAELASAAHPVLSDGPAVLTLLEAPVRTIAEGDGFTIRAGCDKRIETCGTKFANTANFRGFPHIPGQDAVLRYATKDGGHEGGVL